MNQPKLPLPNPLDWATPSAAAAELRVDRVTVLRMADDGRLTPHRIRGERFLFWWPEVEELRDARIRAGIPGTARDRIVPDGLTESLGFDV